MGIVVIGSTFVDVKGFTDSSFIPTGRNSGRIEETHGGVARNIAENLANLELQPTFISLLDDSGTAVSVLERLRRHGVRTEYIRRTKDGMGTWLAIFDPSGDVYASVSKRPDLMPILEILDQHGDKIFRNASAVTIDFDMERPIVQKVLSLAGQYGTPVYGAITNMTIAMERRDLIEGLSCFVCNLQEAGQLFLTDYSGKTPAEMTDILKEQVRRAGLRCMVVTMGAKGAVYADADGLSGICRAMKVPVTDTTGAGDAFFSGVTAGLSQGKSLQEACSIGTRLSAAVIQTTENVCPRFRPEELGLTAPTAAEH